MSTDVSGVNESYPNDTEESPVEEFVAAVGSLADHVDAPSSVTETIHESGEKAVEYVENLERRLAEQEDTSTELTQRQDDVEDDVDDVVQRQDDVEDELKDHDSRLELHLDDICSLESRMDDVEDEIVNVTPTPTDDETAPFADLSPIERLTRLPKDELENEPKKVQRAVTLYENLPAWGQKTAKGVVLKAADNVRQLLSTARGESLRWKQVHRAYEALDELAKDGVEYHRDHSRHGKMVVLRETDAETARCQSSSVGT